MDKNEALDMAIEMITNKKEASIGVLNNHPHLGAAIVERINRYTDAIQHLEELKDGGS